MATKEKKGAKFGRHGRNPSSKLQATRTARNKRLAAERHGPTAGVIPDYTPRKGHEPRRAVEFVTFTSPAAECRTINRRTGETLRMPHLIRSERFPGQVIDVIPS